MHRRQHGSITWQEMILHTTFRNWLLNMSDYDMEATSFDLHIGPSIHGPAFHIYR